MPGGSFTLPRWPLLRVAMDPHHRMRCWSSPFICARQRRRAAHLKLGRLRGRVYAQNASVRGRVRAYAGSILGRDRAHAGSVLGRVRPRRRTRSRRWAPIAGPVTTPFTRDEMPADYGLRRPSLRQVTPPLRPSWLGRHPLSAGGDLGRSARAAVSFLAGHQRKAAGKQGVTPHARPSSTSTPTHVPPDSSGSPPSCSAPSERRAYTCPVRG
jgi:hypothetical protein